MVLFRNQKIMGEGDLLENLSNDSLPIVRR